METEILIIIGVFLTSILSGVMGMGGGLILMALYALILPVNLAMSLHGFTQFFSNGSRTIMHYKKVQFDLVTKYLVGGLIAIFILSMIKFSPSKRMVLISLGIIPFISLLPKISSYFDITKNNRSYLCGFIVSSAQLLVGASGSLLDIFYISSPLNRHTIIANKSITQTIGHVFKMIYYMFVLEGFSEFIKFSPYTLGLIVIFTVIGNYIGKLILKRMNEDSFRRYSKGIILTMGILLMIRGAYAF